MEVVLSSESGFSRIRGFNTTYTAKYHVHQEDMRQHYRRERDRRVLDPGACITWYQAGQVVLSGISGIQ